ILRSRIAKAKSDSSRLARATEVERAITGVSLPKTVVDTPTAVRMNQLSGSLRADGVATGNIKNFSLKGTASGNDIVARGNTVGSHAAALHWGQAGVDVQNLELRNGGNGRIYVNGFVPKQGNANLDIAVDNLDVGDVIALTQSGVNAQGLVSLNVHATGTLDNPQFK